MAGMKEPVAGTDMLRISTRMHIENFGLEWRLVLAHLSRFQIVPVE
jgi:hypothetical protein